MIAKHPFFAVLLMDLLTIEETESVKTAATDGEKLYINPKFFDSLKSIDERVFVLAHEILHVVYRHCPRMRLYQLRGFGPDLTIWSNSKWNQATDYIINYTLVRDKVGTMPALALYHPDYTADMLADELYKQMPDDEPKDRMDEHMPGKDAAPGTVERAVASAVQAAKAQGRLPGSMERMFKEILEPQVSWADKLRTSVAMNAGRDQSTWNRPNRRRMAMPPHIYLPGVTGVSAGNLCVYIDTSGSISPGELAAFMAEIGSIYQDFTPKSLYVGCCDATAYEPDEITEVSQLEDYKMKGGGGTHMPAIYKELKRIHMKPDLLIIFTDGYTDWDSQPDYPVTIVSTTDQHAPYGENIRITL
jgi:predicted metal-dependent peptidase